MSYEMFRKKRVVSLKSDDTNKFIMTTFAC